MSILSKFEMAETSVLHLRDARDMPMYADGEDGKPDTSKPIRVHVYGPGSKQYAHAKGKQNNLLMQRSIRPDKYKDPTPEERLQEDIDLLVACTRSFENVGDETAESIYSNQLLSFIRDQVLAHVNETKNFSKPSGTN